jgi:hypothetical protein
MRHLLVLATLIVLVVLVGSLLRMPAKRVPWLVIGYFAAHAVYVLAGWWVLQRFAVESPEYFRVYAWGSVPALAMAIAVALRYSLEDGPAAAAVMSGVFAATVCIGLAERVMDARNLDSLPAVIVWHFVTTAVFLACGMATFLSLAAPTGDIETATKLALAGFWLAFGAYEVAYAIAHLNPHMSWVVRQAWVPPFVALAAFLWLAVKLHGGHAELARQGTIERNADERAAMELVFERRSR